MAFCVHIFSLHMYLNPEKKPESIEDELPEEFKEQLLLKRPTFDFIEMDNDKYHHWKKVFVKIEGRMVILRSFIAAIPPSLFALSGTFIFAWFSDDYQNQSYNAVGIMILLGFALRYLLREYSTGQLSHYYLETILKKYEEIMVKKIHFQTPEQRLIDVTQDY